MIGTKQLKIIKNRLIKFYNKVLKNLAKLINVIKFFPLWPIMANIGLCYFVYSGLNLNIGNLYNITIDWCVVRESYEDGEPTPQI